MYLKGNFTFVIQDNETINSTLLNNYIPKFNSSERAKMLKELEDHNLIYVKSRGRSMQVKLNPKIKKMPPEDVLNKYFGSN